MIQEGEGGQGMPMSPSGIGLAGPALGGDRTARNVKNTSEQSVSCSAQDRGKQLMTGWVQTQGNEV